MGMSKKDYEILARVVQEGREDFKSNTTHARFALELAKVLEDDNPRFDPERFIMASMPRHLVGASGANVWERLAERAAAR